MDLQELSQKLGNICDGYAKKFAINRSPDWYLLKLQEEVGELSAAYLKLSGRARPKGEPAAEVRQNLQDEIADVLAMILLFAQDQGIDAEAAVRGKWFPYLDQGARCEATPTLETQSSDISPQVGQDKTHGA